MMSVDIMKVEVLLRMQAKLLQRDIFDVIQRQHFHTATRQVVLIISCVVSQESHVSLQTCIVEADDLLLHLIGAAAQEQADVVPL